MFHKAFERIDRAVRPIVPIWRTTDGGVFNGVGAGVVVNGEGWMITSGHALSKIQQINQQCQDNTAPERSRRRKRQAPKAQQFKVLIGNAIDVKITDIHVNTAIDLGLFKVEGLPLDGFNPPVFRKDRVKPGELLCRIGYPFTEKNLVASWDAGKNSFVLNGDYPPSCFVNEALVSRFVRLQSTDGKLLGTWIETSSPGLMGQSGGPLADQDGAICGIQVNTEHYPLGFKNRGRGQVLNVGRAVEVSDVRKLLDNCGVAYKTENEP